MTTTTNIQILSGELRVDEIRRFIQDDVCGGMVLFIGNVRNQTANKKVLHLEFEAYEPMALKELSKIAANIFTMWPAAKVAIHHRIGLLRIGESAVVIGVSCPHRKEAFDACSYAIDELKKTVPIWKKEVFEDGEVWVASHP